jgi:predicted glycosyltransferase
MLDQSEWMNKVIQMAVELDFDVHLRLHPNFENKGRKLRRRWEEIGKSFGVTLHTQSSQINTYDLIRTSDLVITCGSTVALEAVYLGRPVLSIGSGLYDNIGAIYKSQDLLAIKEILSSRNFMLLKGNLDRALEFGFYEIFKKRQFTTEATYSQGKAIFDMPGVVNRGLSKIVRSINLL